MAGKIVAEGIIPREKDSAEAVTIDDSDTDVDEDDQINVDYLAMRLKASAEKNVELAQALALERKARKARRGFLVRGWY